MICRIFILLLFSSILVSLSASQGYDQVLWPGPAPGDIAGEVGEEKVETKGVKRISNVSEPSIPITYLILQKQMAPQFWFALVVPTIFWRLSMRERMSASG